MADLLKELSNHNERSEERKGALVELLKITREDSAAVWDEHFKTILLLLLETLCDKDVGSGSDRLWDRSRWSLIPRNKKRIRTSGRY